jgi:hypothetical protein
MTTATAFSRPVSAQDRRALRSADSVVFRLYQGQATVEANLRGDRTSNGFDQKHTVFAETSVRDYSAEHYAVGAEGYTGFVMFHSGVRYNPVLDTLVEAMAPGSMLRLEWTRGNDNENNRQVGWVRDELRMVVISAKGKVSTFLVDVQVGPDNTARMVKRA